ncbi:hypothetical protein D3C71_1746570 [compost metagenome]
MLYAQQIADQQAYAPPAVVDDDHLALRGDHRRRAAQHMAQIEHPGIARDLALGAARERAQAIGQATRRDRRDGTGRQGFQHAAGIDGKRPRIDEEGGHLAPGMAGLAIGAGRAVAQHMGGAALHGGFGIGQHRAK